MAASDSPGSYAALFCELTGQETLTEPQDVRVTDRLDDAASERELATYLDAAATARGFEDVIDEPTSG